MPVALPDSQVVASVGAKAFVTDLTATVAVTGQLVGAKVDLFVNNFTPTALNILTDFTKASWTGYAQATVSGWGAQRTQVDGRIAITATNLMEFTGPAAGSGPTVYGYVVQSSSGALLYSVKFGAPVSMVDNTQVLDLVVTFTLPNVQ